MTTKKRTQKGGPTALARLVKRHGGREIARRLRVSEASVRAWMRGDREPSGAARAHMMAHGIPDEWGTSTKPASSTTIAPPVAHTADAAPAAPSAPATASEGIHAQIVEIKTDIAKARSEGASARELAALQTSLTSALRLLSQLSGERAVTEATILRSSAWARIAKALRETLTPFPEVAKLLGEALAALSEGGT